MLEEYDDHSERMLVREEVEREVEIFWRKYKPAATARRGKMANRATDDAAIVIVRVLLNPAQNLEHSIHHPNRTLPMSFPGTLRDDDDNHKINIDE